MINDRKILISTGANRKSMNWQKLELNWSDFVKRFEKPTRSLETLDEFLKMSKAEQDKLKDVGGFVGGELKGARRKSENVVSRDLITLDFDNIPSGNTEDVIKRVMVLGCAYLIYSTRKHASYKPRLRIVIPLNRTVSVDEYEPIARWIARAIGIEMADPTTFEPSRLMYWASCSRDSEYVFEYEDKPFTDADAILNSYEDWRDISSWPQVPGQDIKHRKLLTRQEDPTSKQGLIGAFCRTYDIYSAMDKYIPEAYDGADEGRFTYMGGSTTGGAVVYQDGLFLYSHHATDPCSGQLVNAWDLVRLHKFGYLDEEAVAGTPTGKLPSTTAMKDLARSDKAVVDLLNKERLEGAKSYFDSVLNSEAPADSDSDTEDDNNWTSLFDYDAKGNIKNVADNILLVLANDKKYKGKIFLDEFANRGMVTCPLPWDASEDTREWKDSDDAHLELMLRKEYNLSGKEKIATALTAVADINKRNEVKQALERFRWDGVQRIPTLLSDYLGAEQNSYTADVMKKSLVAAVARAIASDGVKFDYMVVFSGKQGLGKSTFLNKLGMKWFSDSLYNFEGKEAAELIQGTLINEVGELSAMNKSETETIKQFLSKTHDIYRAAYGRHTHRYPRRCVFFGSTNDTEFLKDATGNRRFWPVPVGEYEPTKSIFRDLDKEIELIWAEAYTYYVLGENLFLEGESLEIAERMQSLFREEDPRRGAVVAFLEKKIPENWYSLDNMSQRKVLSGEFPTDSLLMEREKVCVREIWTLCFGGELKNLKQKESREIFSILSTVPGWERTKNPLHFGAFGKQKGYVKSKIIEFKFKQNV